VVRQTHATNQFCRPARNNSRQPQRTDQRGQVLGNPLYVFRRVRASLAETGSYGIPRQHLFYEDLVSRLRARGVLCAITSGLACVHYGVAETTQACDLLCHPGSFDALFFKPDTLTELLVAHACPPRMAARRPALELAVKGGSRAPGALHAERLLWEELHGQRLGGTRSDRWVGAPTPRLLRQT